MKKIILKGNETNQKLRDLLEENKVEYSKLDNKSKLIERINDYNSSLDVVNKVIKKDEKIPADEIVDELVMRTSVLSNYHGQDLITGSQYCNIKGVNKRVSFFINKKYKDEKYTNNEWDEIFVKEKLV